MFKNVTLDFWLAKSDKTMRKLMVNAEVQIPQELGLTGINGATLAATLNLDEPNKALTFKAPDSPKPFTQLQQDMQTNPLFSGFLEGLSGIDTP